MRDDLRKAAYLALWLVGAACSTPRIAAQQSTVHGQSSEQTEFNGTITVRDEEECGWCGGARKKLDSRGHSIAAQVELGVVLRILRGSPPDHELPDEGFFRDPATTDPVYLVADEPIILPAEAPRFLLANSVADVEAVVRRTHQNAYYIRLTAKGMRDAGDGRIGVDISFDFGVVCWEHLNWDALSEQERQQREDQRPSHIHLFGGATSMWAIRDGQGGIVFYDSRLRIMSRWDDSSQGWLSVSAQLVDHAENGSLDDETPAAIVRAGVRSPDRSIGLARFPQTAGGRGAVGMLLHEHARRSRPAAPGGQLRALARIRSGANAGAAAAGVIAQRRRRARPDEHRGSQRSTRSRT